MSRESSPLPINRAPEPRPACREPSPRPASRAQSTHTGLPKVNILVDPKTESVNIYIDFLKGLVFGGNRLGFLLTVFIGYVLCSVTFERYGVEYSGGLDVERRQ